MLIKKILGFLFLIIGALMLFGSYYIHHKIDEAKSKILGLQEQVASEKVLVSLPSDATPKEFGKGLPMPAPQEITKGVQKISSFLKIASWLKTGGIVLIVVGTGLCIWGFTDKKKTRRR